MLIDRIMAAAGAKAQRRKQPNISAYNCGKCVRSLWYTAHGYPPEPPDARAQLLFSLGDKVEDSILDWLAETKVGHIRTNEWRDAVEMPELGGRVRSDFIFECDMFPYSGAEQAEPGTLIYIPGDVAPPQAGDLLVGEIKSMSDFAFQRAQRGLIDDAYLAQVECYLRAYDCRHALVIAYRKETSHLAEILIARSDERWAWILGRVAVARAEPCPVRPYELESACKGCGGTGKTEVRKQDHKACGGTGLEPGGPFLPSFPCGYCGWKSECWGTLELAFRDGRPRWRLASSEAAA